MIELFELRICDGFGSSSSIFLKGKTMAEAVDDLEKTAAMLRKLSVDVGRVELRDEQDRLVQAEFFTAAAERAAAKRRQARRDAFRQKMYESGLDDEDLRV